MSAFPSVALAVVVAVMLSSCGAAPAPTAPHSDPPEVKGWLGFAARPPSADHGDWLPSAVAPIVVPVPDDGVLAGPALVLTGTGVLAGRFTGRESIPYGCDNNHLDVLTVEVATRPPPGVVWVMPAPLPAGWSPRGVAIVPLYVRAHDAAWQVGALTVALAVVDHDHAALAIRAGDRALVTLPYEREVMTGDDTTAQPIDLTAGTPGMPVPIAAWQLAPGGAVLIALRIPARESNNLSAVLADGAHAALLPLAESQYQCAF